MPALGGMSSIAMTGLGLSCTAVGCVLRHWWGLHADRAGAARVALLCDQLDAKDKRLQELRVELQAVEAHVRELLSETETRSAVMDSTARPVDGHAHSTDLDHDQALLSENNEGPAFFRRRIRALESRAALNILPARRVG